MKAHPTCRVGQRVRDRSFNCLARCSMTSMFSGASMAMGHYLPGRIDSNAAVEDRRHGS